MADRQIRSLLLVDQPQRPSFIDTDSPVYFENEWDCSMLPYSTFQSVGWEKIQKEEKFLIQLSFVYQESKRKNKSTTSIEDILDICCTFLCN